MAPLLEREEYVEQAYFFRVLRERLHERFSTQEVLSRIHDEILSITKLPMAIQFLASEIKHTGLLSSGFKKLPHYFTPFQAFVVSQTEDDRKRFSIDIALMILEREAQFRADSTSARAMFMYQFETLSRNRLGYLDGLTAMRSDPLFDDAWRGFIELVRRQVGLVDFAMLVYLRSDLYLTDQRRQDPEYQAPLEPLFGEKEGKIAKANRGRDPIYLFASLQRQLAYPEVPRAAPTEGPLDHLLALKAKYAELEKRVKLLEAEARGKLDLKEFMVKPDDIKPAGAFFDEEG